MLDPVIRPAARAARFLLITPTVAATLLWAGRGWVPQPWLVLRFLYWDLHAMMLRHEFYFAGHWLVPGWRLFPLAYRYLAVNPEASAAVGAALFVGGFAALWIDRLIVRWHVSPTRQML